MIYTNSSTSSDTSQIDTFLNNNNKTQDILNEQVIIDI